MANPLVGMISEASQSAKAPRSLSPCQVTICIANWNCRDLLRCCLRSLLSEHQGVNLQVIVVDNGSTDGAPRMVAREFPQVLLLRNQANRGFSRANNQAAAHATGRYLLFLNNDTVVPPGTIQRLLEFADANPEIGLLGPRLRDGHNQWQVSYRRRPSLGTLLHRTAILRWTRLFRGSYRRYRRKHFDPENIRQVEVLMGAALFVPRKVFFDCGGWDEEFVFGGEDLDLCLRVNRRFPVVYFPRAEIIHYGRASTRQHIGFASTQMAIGFVRYLRKAGYGVAALLAYKLAVTLDAPIQFLGKAMQYAWRRLRGDHQKAEKSRLACQAWGHFLVKGLWGFWRA